MIIPNLLIQWWLLSHLSLLFYSSIYELGKKKNLSTAWIPFDFFVFGGGGGGEGRNAQKRRRTSSSTMFTWKQVPISWFHQMKKAPSAWGHFICFRHLEASHGLNHIITDDTQMDTMLYITSTMFSYWISISVPCSRKCSASIPAEELQPGVLLSMNTSKILGLYPDSV